MKTKKLKNVNLILFYLLSFRLGRLALCENAGHGDAISFITNADLIASSTTFDSLGFEGLGWIFCTFIIELDAIVFISGSDQVFLKGDPLISLDFFENAMAHPRMKIRVLPSTESETAIGSKINWPKKCRQTRSFHTTQLLKIPGTGLKCIIRSFTKSFLFYLT